MSLLAKLISKIITKQPIYWLSLAVSLFLIAGFTRYAVDQFYFLQAQNLSNLSVFNEIILPLSGLVLIIQLLFSLIVTSFHLPRFNQTNQAFLFWHSNLSILKLTQIFIVTQIRITCLPLLLFVFILFWLSFYTSLDIARSLTLVMSVAAIWFVLSILFVLISLKSRQSLHCFLLGFGVVSGLLLLEMLIRLNNNFEYYRGIFLPFLTLRQGVFSVADIANYIILIVLGTYLTVHQIAKLKNVKIKNNIPVFAVLGVSLFLVSLIPLNYDFTDQKRNSIEASLIEKLKTQSQPLNIIAVVNDETSRDEIMRGFSLIKKAYPETKISFQSRQSLKANLSHTGEFIQINLGELQQSVAYPFDQEVKLVFEQAIDKLLTRKHQWITIIEGHKEASPFGKSTSDIKQFYQTLKQMGWPIAVQNLTQFPLNDRTELLIIASPKEPWLPGEMAQVINYLNQGKSLLLLIDPDSEVPAQLSAYLGVVRHKGTLVDWQGFQRGTPHPAVLVVDQFKSHPVVSNLSQLLAFPWASALKVHINEESNFTKEIIIETHQGVWNEFDIDAESLAFEEAKGEKQQAFPLALSLQNKTNQQKIIIIGDSHFLTDSAINNYDNMQFALNLVSWLTNSEISRSVDNKDSSLVISSLGFWVLNFIFLMGLPFICVIVALNEFRLKVKNAQEKSA